MLGYLLFLVILSGPSRNPVPEIRVDMIEVNHLMDRRSGTVSFTQAIFWKENPATGKYRSYGFVMIQGMTSNAEFTRESGIPRVQGLYNSKPFRITGKLARESWTNQDPEREDLQKPGHPGSKIWDELDYRVPKESRDARDTPPQSEDW